MDESTFVKRLLDINQPIENNPTRYSLIALLLKNARKLSGRNTETGIYEMNEYFPEDKLSRNYFADQLSSLLNYLILLEQIGKIFIPKNPPNVNKGNEIFLALSYFSEIDESRKAAIIALRDSLAHSNGLATSKKRTKGCYKFILSKERNSNVIEPKLWEGDYSDNSDLTSTTVYVIDFAELVENVYEKVVLEWGKGNLNFLIDSEDKFNELKMRYTFTI